MEMRADEKFRGFFPMERGADEKVRGFFPMEMGADEKVMGFFPMEMGADEKVRGFFLAVRGFYGAVWMLSDKRGGLLFALKLDFITELHPV